MRSLSNVATLDRYDPATTIEEDQAVTLTYIVANQPVIAQFRSARRDSGGYGSYSNDLPITQEKNVVPNVSGAKFKSAIAGQPARVIAYLSTPDDPQIGAGIPFLSILAASGGITQMGLIAAGELQADVALTKAVNTEAAPLTVFTLPAIKFDGLTPHVLEVYWPGWVTTEALGSGFIGVNLWDDTPIDLGRMWDMEQGGKASSGYGSIYAARRFTPPNATKTYRIRAWCTAANVALRAGAGGVGVYGPAYYRLFTDPVTP